MICNAQLCLLSTFSKPQWVWHHCTYHLLISVWRDACNELISYSSTLPRFIDWEIKIFNVPQVNDDYNDETGLGEKNVRVVCMGNLNWKMKWLKLIHLKQLYTFNLIPFHLISFLKNFIKIGTKIGILRPFCSFQIPFWIVHNC